MIIYQSKHTNYFTEKLHLKLVIRLTPFTGGHVESNFLLFLCNNKSNKTYQNCIKSIAIAGCMFSICFYLILSFIFIFLSYIGYYKIIVFLGVTIAFICIEILQYIFPKSSNADKLNYCYPELFEYKY